MFDKRRRYSYAVQKTRRYRILWIVLCLAVLYILYNSLTSFFFPFRVLENNAMQPSLYAGDCVIFSSFSVHSLLSNFGPGKKPLPFRRGTVVLIDMSGRNGGGVFLSLFDGIVRFFTAQRADLFGKEDRLYVKRVIGLPGDEITMTNFVIRVKPKDGSYNLTEFELSDKPYDITIPQVPALWDESLPFSGNTDRIILGEDECFVLSDDRSNTNDSRTWGPVRVDHITGKALFRYWPLNSLGPP
ncbi:MAG: signal peptidase I [Treponema sp.]|jgi:signal peptidase I|nr:signal peptidase I [Treponema sp.]